MKHLSQYANITSESTMTILNREPIKRINAPGVKNTEMGIYLTQVTTRCRIWGNGRLSSESGRVRGAFRQRAGLSRVSVSTPLAGGFSLSALRA